MTGKELLEKVVLDSFVTIRDAANLAIGNAKEYSQLMQVIDGEVRSLQCSLPALVWANETIGMSYTMQMIDKAGIG